MSRPDWEIFAGVAEAMGRPLGFRDLGTLRAEAAPARAALGDLAIDHGPGPDAPSGWANSTLLSYPLLVDEGRLSQGRTS